MRFVWMQSVFLLVVEVVVCLTLSIYSATCSALDLDAAEIRGQQRRNPVAVLQNRYFTKSLRPEVGVSYGSFLNEAYTDTSLQGLRASIFLGEWVGLEFQSFTTTVENSNDREALNRLRYRRVNSEDIISPDPEINPIYGVQDYSVIFAPFYGKLNLMNQMILYSDLYLSAGIARVETMQGEKTSATFGVGQRFYFFKSLSFRVDFKDRVYSEQRSDLDAIKHAYSVDFGASYLFF